MFALHHAEAGAEVCARVRDSICAAAAPLHACIARLLLLSDILFNRQALLSSFFVVVLKAQSFPLHHKTYSPLSTAHVPCAHNYRAHIGDAWDVVCDESFVILGLIYYCFCIPFPFL